MTGSQQSPAPTAQAAQALAFVLDSEIARIPDSVEGYEPGHLPASNWWPGLPGSPDVCGTCGDVYCSGGLVCEQAKDMPRAMWDAAEYRGREAALLEVRRLSDWLWAEGRHADANVAHRVSERLTESLEVWVDGH